MARLKLGGQLVVDWKGVGSLHRVHNAVPNQCMPKSAFSRHIPPCRPALFDVLVPSGMICLNYQPALVFCVLHKLLEMFKHQHLHVRGLSEPNREPSMKAMGDKCSSVAGWADGE